MVFPFALADASFIALGTTARAGMFLTRGSSGNSVWTNRLDEGQLRIVSTGGSGNNRAAGLRPRKQSLHLVASRNLAVVTDVRWTR